MQKVARRLRHAPLLQAGQQALLPPYVLLPPQPQYVLLPPATCPALLTTHATPLMTEQQQNWYSQ